jgi:superfamily II DNA or RNA helicase
MPELFQTKPIVGKIIPRDYQLKDVEQSFKLWDKGVRGTLTRVFTGGGKTLQTCIKFQKWLERGDDYRCMVISYEKQLVWQFAQEVRDYTGLEPGIEMQDQHCSWDQTPQIIVASRQTLMRHKLAQQSQKDELSRYGLGNFGLLLSRQAKSLITEIERKLNDGEQPDYDLLQEQIEDWNRDPRCNHELGMVSRLWKFNPDFNWLIAWDEAHKHAYKLKTVNHIVDWFHKNPNSRDTGMTATPQRYDNVSIGDKMFPGVAIDYPLWSLNDKCAVRDGFAVPYVQKFIRVESLDFKRLKQECKSQLEWDSQVDQALEGQLAKCVEPLLSGPLGEMVGDRRTIIFSPSVDMAKNVAHYINARRQCECNCGTRGWYSKELIGDGIRCTGCDEFIEDKHIINHPEQARSVYGTIPPIQRREHYAAHQNGQYQFLSVCGLCREGYNDRDIACAVILRPVSRAAASLAEQMKGRASRVAPGVIDGLATAAERIEAIKNSCKPNALIVDLVGVTGLADCANSAMIYAEGLPDEVIEIAERALDEGEEDIAKAVEEAKEEYDSEIAKQEREAKALQEKVDAARRARLQATVNYEIEEIGYATSRPTDATFKQLKYIRFLGMDFVNYLPSKRQARLIITQLKEEYLPAEQVARSVGVPEENWRPVRASAAQRRRLTREGKVYDKQTITPAMASQLIDGTFDVYQMIRNAETHEALDAAGRYVRNLPPGRKKNELIAVGKTRRKFLEDF